MKIEIAAKEALTFENVKAGQLFFFKDIGAPSALYMKIIVLGQCYGVQMQSGFTWLGSGFSHYACYATEGKLVVGAN